MVPAIVYRPDPHTTHWRGKLPGIVVVNGHGGEKFSWYAFYSGMLFARAGAVAAASTARMASTTWVNCPARHRRGERLAFSVIVLPFSMR